MKIRIFTVAAMAATVLLAGCHQFQKTKSGLPYKIISGGSHVTFKQGQFIKFNIEYKLAGKDTILNSTFGHIPAYMQIDTSRMGKYNFTEVITKCAVGDELDFQMSVDTLKKMGVIPDYNNIFRKKDVINGKIKFIQVYSNEKDVNADFMKSIDLEKTAEIKTIQALIAKSGEKVQQTKNGVFVDVKNPGNGPKADSGKVVKLFYTGTLISNNKVFDANIGPKATHKDPFSITLGAHSVIPGLEEGLKYFAKGGVGRIYIPAMMAYAMQGQPPVIPPYSNLIFDIQVSDVALAPAKSAKAPIMNPSPNVPSAKK